MDEHGVMLRCLAESIQMTTMETAVVELLVAIPEYVPEESRDLDLPDVVHGDSLTFCETCVTAARGKTSSCDGALTSWNRWL
jgi:hypothetical protein